MKLDIPIPAQDVLDLQELAELTNRSLSKLVGDIVGEFRQISLDAQLEFARKKAAKLKMRSAN